MESDGVAIRPPVFDLELRHLVGQCPLSAQEFEIDRLNAYQLCSQVAKVRLANMVDTLYTIVAKFPRKFLPRRRQPG